MHGAKLAESHVSEMNAARYTYLSKCCETGSDGGSDVGSVYVDPKVTTTETGTTDVLPMRILIQLGSDVDAELMSTTAPQSWQG